MKTPLFNKVAIVGVGLIGGSIGLAVKKKKLAKWVTGAVRRERSAIAAVEAKAVDMVTLELGEAVKDADLVILCAPVSTIVKQLPLIKPFLKKGAIVIDAGSSKQRIEGAARKLKTTFIGCHPMAGSANTGVQNARADLFEGAQCFLTKPHAKVAAFWKALGAHPVVLSAKLHDAWVARASYLPHILAFSLFQKKGLGKFPGKLKALNPSAQELARLAKSDATLWSDILRSNKETLAALKELESNLSAFKKLFSSKDSKKLQRFIEHSNQISERLSSGGVE